MQKILFTGGGSAGHVIPNVALIQELQKTGEYDLCYFGTSGIEKGLITPLKIPYFTYAAPKLKRGCSFDAIKNNLAIPHRFLQAISTAKKKLQEIRPDVVFSKGGYVALPVVYAAARLGIPCLTHESDLSPGLANKLMAKKCKRVLTAFPETAKRFSRGVYCGQPLRGELFGRSKSAAKRELTGGTQRKVILIFGGGSGSAAINDAIRKLAPALCRKYYLLHVCGKNGTLQSSLKNYRQFPFIKDMGAAYAAADLIISRAGAGAVFETLALKKPAIFIPLEGQTRGDQMENARYFSEKQLCYLLPQSRLDELPQTIERALADNGLKERLLTAPYSSGTKPALQIIRECLQAEKRP